VDETVPQTFRDSLAYHLYMLYSLMFLVESEQGKGIVKDKNDSDSALVASCRLQAIKAFLRVTECMSERRAFLWSRGVPGEAVIMLPCRISYVLLEKATGVVIRKTMCGDQALHILQVTVKSYDNLLTSVSVALLDLMHSHEHMAQLVAELVFQTSDGQLHSNNRLGIELIKETGRIQGNEEKASGIKFVAPFFTELSRLQPRLVHANFAHWLPHLNAESYSIRSAIVAAIAHLLIFIDNEKEVCTSSSESASPTEDTPPTSRLDRTKTRDAFLDLLMERMFDVSSFTRAAVMKSWIRLVEANALPVDRVHSVARAAVERLQDKTVIVRKHAMQV
jgi:condensin complex subunit 1